MKKVLMGRCLRVQNNQSVMSAMLRRRIDYFARVDRS